MKKSNINDYVQLAATIGIAVGLVLVGFQIRQSNTIAFQETVSSNWATHVETQLAQFDSDVPDAIAKSMTNPDELTLAELIKINAWLTAVMSTWQGEYDTVALGGVGQASNIANQVAADAWYLFGNEITRNWYRENTYWLAEEIVQAIDKQLSTTPLGSDLEYYKRIQPDIR